MGSRLHRYRPLRVWVPVTTNVVLVVLAAIAGDATAVALTSVAAVVTTGAVVLHVRAAEADQERIAYLQASLPRLTTSVDAEGVLNLAPKPSAHMGEVLRQHLPLVDLGPATPIAIPPIDPD